MTRADQRRAILAAAQHLGLERTGISRIEALPRAELLERWLAEGRAGDMRFLLHHRKARIDPRSRYPWARSMLSATLSYRPPPRWDVDWRGELRGRIAAYALGADYHDRFAQLLDAWAHAITTIAPGTRCKVWVDTGPVLEHEWAARAGLGWTGKHTLTLHEEAGSWFFLGEVLTDLELEPDRALPERCGTCSRCIDACPTAAIEPGNRLEPRRCISYLTIESRGAIDRELRAAMGEWLYGCDLCQIACPWNAPPVRAPQGDLAPSLAEILALDEAGFTRRFGASAIARAGRVGLARNAAVVLGNTGNPAALASLERCLATDPSPLVRTHAAWAVGRLASNAGVRARQVLERSLADPDPVVIAEAQLALDA